jgi:hypothetical protein
VILRQLPQKFHPDYSDFLPVKAFAERKGKHENFGVRLHVGVWGIKTFLIEVSTLLIRLNSTTKNTANRIFAYF